MSMKEVWAFYNKSFKNRTQTKIKLDTEQEHLEFMQFWKSLYKDEYKD